MIAVGWVMMVSLGLSLENLAPCGGVVSRLSDGSLDFGGSYSPLRDRAVERSTLYRETINGAHLCEELCGLRQSMSLRDTAHWPCPLISPRMAWCSPCMFEVARLKDKGKPQRLARCQSSCSHFEGMVIALHQTKECGFADSPGCTSGVMSV